MTKGVVSLLVGVVLGYRGISFLMHAVYIITILLLTGLWLKG